MSSEKSDRIIVPPLGRLARLADAAMNPIMVCLSGAPNEAPQRTHRWNNRRLTEKDTDFLEPAHMMTFDGIQRQIKRGRVRFHLPIFGGWRQYVVLEPVGGKRDWHVGWVTGGVRGVSQIRLNGPVRLLRGPEPISFFGICAHNYFQIGICWVWSGVIGEGGFYSRVPLL